jgi:hypothetical protein
VAGDLVPLADGAPDEVDASLGEDRGGEQRRRDSPTREQVEHALQPFAADADLLVQRDRAAVLHGQVELLDIERQQRRLARARSGPGVHRRRAP